MIWFVYIVWNPQKLLQNEINNKYLHIAIFRMLKIKVKNPSVKNASRTNRFSFYFSIFICPMQPTIIQYHEILLTVMRQHLERICIFRFQPWCSWLASSARIRTSVNVAQRNGRVSSGYEDSEELFDMRLCLARSLRDKLSGPRTFPYQLRS